MTEALRQKTSARRVLLMLAGLLIAVLGLQGIASVGPDGFKAFAQATTTPAGPTIKLINPDSTTSDEVSVKNDGRDAFYHLVAWVGNAPQTPAVQFKFKPSTGDEVTIECKNTGSSQAGFVSPDTYECMWDLAGIPEAGAGATPGADAPSNGTVAAVLYSNGVEVNRDSEPVAVNNQDRPTATPPDFTRENQGNTVEITYPTNGGTVGFYTPPGAKQAVGIIDVSTSEGTQTVQVYYSKAAPGAEPAFSACGASSGETRANSTDGVRCTLKEGDLPSQVTAIAAVARDLNEDPIGTGAGTVNLDAADGHRAFGYEQDPSAVTLNPPSHQAVTGKCSSVITGTVFDQLSPARKIAGANVDVHAQGPNDQLRFDDTSGGNSTASQPPDQGGHAAETTRDCETVDNPPEGSSNQGEHDALGGGIKHIESAATGTTDAGEFKFQLFSSADGQTQISFWADEDGNDLFCSEEAHAFGSIGWNQAAAAPTGVAATQTTCPKPTPGVTATPTPTGTPTGTPTSTATPTPGAARTVTLAASDSKVPAGSQVVLSGKVLSNTAACQDGEFVQLRRRVHGQTQFRDFGTTTTDAQGNFSVETRVSKSADYVAVAPANTQCAEASSDPVPVLVKVLVELVASDKTPERGTRIRFKGAVRPQHDGTRLVLQRKEGRRWVKVDVAKLNRNSVATFIVEADFRSATFRAKWPKQHEDHVSGTSRPVKIETR